LWIWQTYPHLHDFKSQAPQNKLTAIFSLITHVFGMNYSIMHYNNTVRRNFQTWILKRHEGNVPKFNKEQIHLLGMIHDHIASFFYLERDDLHYAPFDAQGVKTNVAVIWIRSGCIDDLNKALDV
jgi:type I restriction enzyme, R subunit